MRFKFKSSKLERLYETEEGARRYPPEVVNAFFEAMSVIRAAIDERDLYALKGFRFEKLGGQRGKTGDRNASLTEEKKALCHQLFCSFSPR